jgi:hypothetical protein
VCALYWPRHIPWEQEKLESREVDQIPLKRERGHPVADRLPRIRRLISDRHFDPAQNVLHFLWKVCDIFIDHFSC